MDAEQLQALRQQNITVLVATPGVCVLFIQTIILLILCIVIIGRLLDLADTESGALNLSRVNYMVSLCQ